MKTFNATDISKNRIPWASLFTYYDSYCPEWYDLWYIVYEWEYGYNVSVYYRCDTAPYKDFLLEHPSKTVNIKYIDLNNGMRTTHEVYYNKKTWLKDVVIYTRESF